MAASLWWPFWKVARRKQGSIKFKFAYTILPTTICYTNVHGFCDGNNCFALLWLLIPLCFKCTNQIAFNSERLPSSDWRQATIFHSRTQSRRISILILAQFPWAFRVYVIFHSICIGTMKCNFHRRHVANDFIEQQTLITFEKRKRILFYFFFLEKKEEKWL